MKRLIFGLLILSTASLTSCWKMYPDASIPEKVSPLSDLNTSGNDYNMNIDFATGSMTFIYSSDSYYPELFKYNLIPKSVAVSWDRYKGDFRISADDLQFGDGERRVIDWVNSINSVCNERGPYSFSVSNTERIMLYSNDCDSKFSIYAQSDDHSRINQRTEKFPFRILGNNGNEMYPSFYGSAYVKTSDFEKQGRPEKLIFTSDEMGNFDLFEVDLPVGIEVINFLANGQMKEVKKLPISTEFNDHAPYVYGRLLVFASDRPGGFGGYDLYFSRMEGGSWSEPVNFGKEINSSADEFRPVISDMDEFDNRLMVFSSNRIGGLGGFDLYFVGIPKF